MKKIGITLLCLALAVIVFCGEAEARRFGGGGSFGGRPGYSRTYRSPSFPAPASGRRQFGPSRQGPAQGPTGSGTGRRLGWGLGGLLAGGFLGSLLFGHGMMGGWGGGGLLDILLLGLVVWFIVRMMSRRPAARRRAKDAEWGRPPPAGGNDRPDDARLSRAERSWDELRSRRPEPQSAAFAGNDPGGFGAAANEPGVDAPDGPVVPEGFDVSEFLEGAKGVYVRLQRSWDRRDLDDIALFTTPDVLAELKRQAAADPEPSKTELLLVKARLVEFREESNDTVASVLFDVLMREDPAEERPEQVREVWHFSRPTGDLDANWRLEGIQQLEG